MTAAVAVRPDQRAARGPGSATRLSGSSHGSADPVDAGEEATGWRAAGGSGAGRCADEDTDAAGVAGTEGPAGPANANANANEDASATADAGERRPAGSESPGALRMTTVRLLMTFVEVVGGFRPLEHLRQFCRPDQYDLICHHLRGRPVAGTPPHLRGAAAFVGRRVVVGRLAGGAPPRQGRATQRCPAGYLAIRRVQICQISPDKAEIVAVVTRRGASAAVALRLERTGTRWLCVHLEIV